MSYSVLTCDIVGYTSVIEQPTLPRVLAPVLRLLDSSEMILLPPFKIVGDKILGAKATSDAVFDTFCQRGDATRLPKPIRSRAGHDLWVDPDGNIGYELRRKVKAAFRKIFEDQIKRAEQSLEQKDYPAASRAAAIARAVEPSHLRPLIVRAAVERMQGKEQEENFTRHLASSLIEERIFDQLVEDRLREISSDDWKYTIWGIARRPTACV